MVDGRRRWQRLRCSDRDRQTDSELEGQQGQEEKDAASADAVAAASEGILRFHPTTATKLEKEGTEGKEESSRCHVRK
mgnify:CR=1 FL=1